MWSFSCVRSIKQCLSRMGAAPIWSTATKLCIVMIRNQTPRAGKIRIPCSVCWGSQEGKWKLQVPINIFQVKKHCHLLSQTHRNLPTHAFCFTVFTIEPGGKYISILVIWSVAPTIFFIRINSEFYVSCHTLKSIAFGRRHCRARKLTQFRGFRQFTSETLLRAIFFA